MLDYLEINRRLWDARTDAHIGSAFYDVEGFAAGASSLKDLDLRLLGDVKGKTVLHLQCHFGQDTLSLARMGAVATGLDFSPRAIEEAEKLNTRLGLDARFVCADVYNLPTHLEGLFDIVYTSYGVVGWLPDMQRWADTVRKALKPGGRFVMAEFHPVVWMFDNDFTHFQYSYFNKEAIVEEVKGTYGDRNADIQVKEVGFNHPLSEVLGALLEKGLKLEAFEEQDFSDYNCFQNMVEIAPGRFQIKGLEGKLPMVYAAAFELKA